MIFRTSREAGRPSENVKKKKREKNAVCAAASKITLNDIILIHNKVIAISIIILNELQSHFPICLINNGRRIYQSLFIKKNQKQQSGRLDSSIVFLQIDTSQQ